MTKVAYRRYVVTVAWRVAYSAPMGRSTVAVDAISPKAARVAARSLVGAPADATTTIRWGATASGKDA